MAGLSRAFRAVMVVGLMIGCGGGSSTSEPDTKSPTDTVYTPTELTIAELQTHDKSANCDPQGIENVYWSIEIKGAVVVGGKFSAFKPGEGSDAEALDGYYVGTSDGGANSGIQLAVPASLGVLLEVGDVVDITGEYMEYYCTSQVKATAVSKTGTGTVPEPTVVTAEDLTDTAKAEAYEGVLVTLGESEVTATQDFDVFTVTGGVLVGGKYFRSYDASQGDKLTSITGILDWSYGEYKVEPRGDDDIVVGELAPAQELTIAEIQTAEASTGCDPSSITSTLPKVSVNMVLVTGPRFIAYSPPPNSTSEALDGYYVGTTEGGANNGIQLVVPASVSADLKLGDVVNIEGETMEYYCRTQLKANKVTVAAPTMTLPAATVLTAEIAADPAAMETHEGTLVSVENVTVTEVNQYGEFAVTGGFWVGDIYPTNYTPNVGDELSALTGLLDFSYGNYKIQPRDATDVVVGAVAPAAVMTIAEVQQHNSSVDCSPAEPGGTDPPPISTHGNVSVSGIVLSPIEDVSVTLDGVYIGTDPSGPWSGLLVVYPKTLGLTPALGDEVKFTGNISEFYCFTEMSATTIEVVSSGNTAPAPLALTAAAILADSEQYEGSHITIEDVSVTNIDDFVEFEQFKVTGGLVINLHDYAVTYQPTVGASISSITGALKYGFGAYKLIPFGAEFIVSP